MTRVGLGLFGCPGDLAAHSAATTVGNHNNNTLAAIRPMSRKTCRRDLDRKGKRQKIENVHVTWVCWTSFPHSSLSNSFSTGMP